MDDEIQNLRTEVSRLAGALTDCNKGMSVLATKLVTVGHFLGFNADDDLQTIRIRTHLVATELANANHELEARRRVQEKHDAIAAAWAAERQRLEETIAALEKEIHGG